MNNNQKQLIEVRELILISESGELTDEQRARLSELVASSSAAAAEAAALLDQQAALRDGMRAIAEGRYATTDEAPLPSDVVPQAVRKSGVTDQADSARASLLRRHWPTIAACLLVSNAVTLGLAWMALSPSTSSSQSSIAAGPDSSEYVEDAEGSQLLSANPRLVAMTGCVWDEQETIGPRVGNRIQEGEVLHLHEGIAALELGQPDKNTQAKIRIEGPARLFVRHDGLLELSSGALTADVRWNSGTFTVMTSEGKVTVPEAASFGVIASNGRSEVHVFQGELGLALAWSKDADATAAIREGEAAAMLGDQSGASSILHFEASPAAFASSRSMGFDRLRLTPAYREAIQAAKPAIYWRFEESEDSVANDGLLEDFTGYVGGSVSWYNTAENRALEFGLTETPGMLASRQEWPRQPLDEYTVQFWVKPSHYHKGALLGLVGDSLPDGRSPHSLLIELSGPYENDRGFASPNAMRFLHRSPMSTDSTVGSSCCSVASYSVRQWQQIVARKLGSRLELFCDGEVVATAESDAPLTTGTRVLIGQLYPVIVRSSPSIAHRPFSGQVDEVALYERALSDSEIRRHYELGRPSPADDDSF